MALVCSIEVVASLDLGYEALLRVVTHVEQWGRGWSWLAIYYVFSMEIETKKVSHDCNHDHHGHITMLEINQVHLEDGLTE